MDDRQKARLAVLHHVMTKAGIQLDESVDIRVNIETFFKDDKGWVATATTSAHTDKSYRVTYVNVSGVTIVNEYTASSESRLYDQEPADEDEEFDPDVNDSAKHNITVHVNDSAKHNITVQGVRGYQLGHGNIQHNRF